MRASERYAKRPADTDTPNMTVNHMAAFPYKLFEQSDEQPGACTLCGVRGGLWQTLTAVALRFANCVCATGMRPKISRVGRLPSAVPQMPKVSKISACARNFGTSSKILTLRSEFRLQTQLATTSRKIIVSLFLLGCPSKVLFCTIASRGGEGL